MDEVAVGGRVHEGDVGAEGGGRAAQQRLADGRIRVGVEGGRGGERGEHGEVGPDPRVEGEGERAGGVSQATFEGRAIAGDRLPSRPGADREGRQQDGEREGEEVRAQAEARGQGAARRGRRPAWRRRCAARFGRGRPAVRADHRAVGGPGGRAARPFVALARAAAEIPRSRRSSSSRRRSAARTTSLAPP